MAVWERTPGLCCSHRWVLGECPQDRPADSLLPPGTCACKYHHPSGVPKSGNDLVEACLIGPLARRGPVCRGEDHRGFFDHVELNVHRDIENNRSPAALERMSELR